MLKAEMSRLLTLLILYRSGYIGGKCVSLDDKRSPVKENDVPDIIARFRNREREEERKRTEQSFLVPKEEIVGNDYDLSINKYKQTEYKPVEYPQTGEIMAVNLKRLSDS